MGKGQTKGGGEGCVVKGGAINKRAFSIISHFRVIFFFILFFYFCYYYFFNHLTESPLGCVNDPEKKHIKIKIKTSAIVTTVFNCLLIRSVR